MNIIKVQFFRDIPLDYTGIADFAYGTRYWFSNGGYHRHNGPAAEYTDGDKGWYLNGRNYTEKDFYIVTRLTRRIKIDHECY